jgi:hypothetical protein
VAEDELCGIIAMALKSMSIAKLQDLKANVEPAISEKVSSRREELEVEMSKLEGYAGVRRGRPAGRDGPRGAVAPKYRNPEKPGRGQVVVLVSVRRLLDSFESL